MTAELSDLDDVSITHVAEAALEGSKGVGGASGTVLAKLISLDALKALLGAVREWASRTGRTVEVSIGGDVLKLTGASRRQQDLVLEAWIARHRPGS